MKSYRASSSTIIQAPANCVYEILADYHDGHPLILPKEYFISLEVEKGGIGDGTIIRFSMRVLGKIQEFRSEITEPQPGKVLVERSMDDGGAVTSFVVTPIEQGKFSQVSIATEATTRTRGVLNPLERFLSRMFLERIYRKELTLLHAVARERCRA